MECKLHRHPFAGVRLVADAPRFVQVQQSGVGAEIIAVIIKNAFDFLDAPPLRFSGEDVPLPYAENLEKLALPSTDKILKECLEILQ